MDRTQVKLNKLSNITSDIAQVAFASVVVPFLLDNFNLELVILGLATSIAFWILSIYLARY